MARFSLKGWNVLDWIKGNWTTIKEVAKVGIPLLVTLPLFASNPVIATFVTALGKLILDTLEYWFNK